ncbi:hypothetical protein ACOMHN_027357 [Nucella lapillus]
MSRCKRQQHVVSLLSSREYNHKDNQLRLNQRILRSLVCGDRYEFRKVFEKTSKSVICFEGDKIFMDNYRTAYDGDVSWMQPEDSVVVSSTLHAYLPRAQRAEGQGVPSVVKVLAVFFIQPLRFVCMLEITRTPLRFVYMLEVTRPIFGKDAVDANLREGLLFVTYRNETVRFYDFNQLVEKHQITPQLIENSTQLTINMKLTEAPCCLFESKSEGGDMQLGGNPWHYLVSPVGKRQTFHLRSLETGLIAENGVLKLSADNLELDRAVFHPDDSNRLIHICPEEVRVLMIKQHEGKSVVTPHFVIPVLEHVNSKAVLKPSDVTSSGRRVKRRFTQEMLYGDCLSIGEVCYEDELDLMVVCSTLSVAHRFEGTVGLYHNATGRLLKSIRLDEPTAVYMEHKMSLDKDTLIQVTKYRSNMFQVKVYRLFENCDPGPEKCSKGNKPKVKVISGFGDCEASDSETPRTANPRRRRRQQR